MKKLIITVCLLISGYFTSAQIYSAKTCKITFFSETPLENIEATNKVVVALLNTATKEIVFKIPMITFEFEKDMMREHFNENYVESDKYPKATFKGKINETVDLTTNGTYKLSATGKLTVHGVERERTIEGTIIVKDKELDLKTEFTIALKDHDIDIPKLVVMNLAEEVLVKVHATYVPYKKK